MALVLDPARVVAPLADDDPCGEDLDEAGDRAFLNDVSRIESLLPASFFTRDDEGRQQPFDRSKIDFGRENKALLALLDRTRDLRVLVLLARLAMLDRDLPGFAATLSAVAGLLDARWEAVHPRGDGGYELRGAVLQSLDDMPTVILPLQHVVLCQSRRLGPISFRNVMVADREVPGREDEPAPERGAIVRALEEAEPETLRPLSEALDTIVAQAARIGTLTAASGDYADAVSLERLAGLATRIRDLLAAAGAGAGTGGAAPAPAAADAGQTAPAAGSGSAPRAVGAVATAADASAALSAATLYLRTHEPSSPGEVLVRQARMLVGKSFVEVMRILMPDQAPEAVITVGTSRGLRLSFDQLASVPEDGEAEASDNPWDENADAAGEEPDPPAPPASFRAATRGEATALLREAAAFFRAHEPSSPIPLLLDKAAAMADRDFLSIMRDVLPETGADA